MFSLNNKIAIVTGSEGGIGKAIVEGFSEYGAKVYGWDKKSSQIQCSADHDSISGKKIDITDSEYIKGLVRYIYNKEKRIDILVNCAGVTFPGKAERYNKKDWNQTLSINLATPFWLSQIVFNYMKKTGGSIINITSLFSELGFPDNPAYGASKGGLKQLTKCLAVEWAKFNIRINNLGFGYIKSNMTKRSWNSKRLRDKRTKRIPLGRWGEPKDAVGPAIFLASDASIYVTGQDIYVDGGWLVSGF